MAGLVTETSEHRDAFPIHGTCLFCQVCKGTKYRGVPELPCQATLPWAEGSGGSPYVSHGFIWTSGLPPRAAQKGVEKKQVHCVCKLFSNVCRSK